MKRAFVVPLLVLSVSAAGAAGGWGLARYHLHQIALAAPVEPPAMIRASAMANDVLPLAPAETALPLAEAGRPALAATPSPPPGAVRRLSADEPRTQVARAPQKPGPLRAPTTPADAIEPAPSAAATPAEPSSPPTSSGALKDGVLIVVSIPSQRMFVFKDGEPWASSRVSTGKPGKSTPTGTFTILEKKRRHRSTLYDDAPMPYMQRLTWGGVAMHAGHVPGYRASHGCIRMPHEFARKLYKLTDYDSTVVVVTKKKARSAEQALEAA